MDIQNQYKALETSLIELRASLSTEDADYMIVTTALRALRRSQIAYSLTRYSDSQTPLDNKLHPLLTPSKLTHKRTVR
jgi:hypothetical protein